MSTVPPIGRGTPRWSVAGAPVLLPALTAGLVDRGRASAPCRRITYRQQLGSVLIRSPAPTGIAAIVAGQVVAQRDQVGMGTDRCKIRWRVVGDNRVFRFVAVPPRSVRRFRLPSARY
jgi:hypothetical protein